MAVESAGDLEDLFSTDDFAIDATYQGATIPVIEDKRWVETMGDGGFTKVLTVRTSDLDGDPYGDTITVSGTDYEIINYEPDGTGVAELVLN